MSHLKINTSTRFLLIVCALLLTAGAAVVALREVSAGTLGKFGITEQSRMGKLIGKVAPRTFATKSTGMAQGEAALKLLKDRGQYDSLRQAMETARYRAQAEPQRAGEFAALNPAQEFHSRFTPHGVEVRRRSDEATPKLALTLRGIGYGERQLPVSPGTVTAEDQRIEIQRSINSESAIGIQPGPQSAITEWYVNRPNGLEQGFTIAEPPGGAGERRDGERLRLTLELSGEWRAKLGANGQAVDFSEASGASTVRYDHLVVRDAQGKILPARMSLKQSELRLEVEDAGAVWPVTIDPTFSQQAYLKASNTEGNDRFGESVAVSGDTVVVGASQEDSNATGVNGNQADNSAIFSGAVYVFVRSGVTWTQQAYLKASNTGSDDSFGASVAVSGDTVVVGAELEDSNATGINGNQADNSANGSGAVYVFTRSGVTWTQQAYLKASNTGAGDQFGRSVAVSGDTVIVGAWGEGSNATGVNGNQADNSASQSGAAYVFTRSGVTWTQQAYLKASNTGASDQFGWSVAVSGDTVGVGAIGEDSNATGVNGNQTDNSATFAGAAYIFTRSGVTWTQQAYLKASNTAANYNFGYSVGSSGDTVVVGAYTEDGGAMDSGAAYVFTRSGVTWTQQAYLKASNPDMSDGFGISVALSGDTVVVGAHGEDSNATGVNGSQADNSASASGAAYLFTRSGATWTQQAYLKASNSGANDWFGWSVAVSGDTVVVGALFEDSNATGVNGNQADNSAGDSGAAYVFTSPLNTPPGITAQAGVSRQQGSPVSNSTIATVSDAETAAGSLTVTVTSANPSNSVTLSNIVNTNGTVTANIAAACGATNASFTLQVSDGSNTTTATLNVAVTNNTAPTLTYGSASVNTGASTSNTPTTATDNGSITSYSVQSQGTYTGTISVNSSGVVSISNAAPAGNHTITIRATDNCSATTDATFTLTVGCAAINISPMTLSNAAVGTAYSRSLTVTPSGTYGFAIISGQLPKGLTLSTGGVISGTPSEFGIFTFTVAASQTSPGSCRGSRLYTLQVTGSNCAAPNFTDRADFTAGGGPLGIVAADFNRDGKNDMAVANENGNSVTVLLGDGIGGFPTSNTITGLADARFVDVGDFNGDGNPDLIVALRTGTNVPVLFGNGAGDFPTSTNVNVGFIQSSVRPGDFNGDGKLDFIAFAFGTGNQLSVALGDGMGGFSIAPGSPVQLGFAASGVLNDFNQDGKLDVALARTSPAEVIVMYGDGTGALTADAPISFATNLAGIFTADFNLDGNLDLAVPHSDDSLTLLFGNGSGSFSTAPGSPISGAAASITTDFNGDGIPDLASTNRAGFGNGSGGFTILNGLNTGSDRRAATAADLNGDGKPDLAVINYSSNKIVVVFNNCAPQIISGTTIARQQGSPAANSQIATVSDPYDTAASLTVTATSVPAGLTVTNIVNTGGVITADVSANCAITTGAKTVVLQVSDGALTATANLTVNVTANTAPSVTYANRSVNAGGSTTNSLATATDNGSITGYAVQSQGTYTGTISVNASGVVSISSAAPVGMHTITIRATDNCNATTDATFTLTVGNNPPSITAGAALTRQRGTAGSVSTIATVSDTETAAGSLVVTATTVPTGITITSITNAAGTITANVAASCTATIGANTVVLTVTDGNSGTASANLTVNVTANTAPTLTYAAASVNAGGSTSNSPATATDNGSITGYAVQSQGTYTGTISVNSSGVVSISNAAPVGAHTITIRATDNCNATSDASFTLTVGNNAPTITAGAALTRQRGTAGSVSTIATVNDGETAAGSLLVTATTVPAGLTVTGISNSNGTITANVAADCSATLGANTVVLTVTDGNSGTATANLTVNVTANIAPTLTYGAASVNAGGSTTNSPTAASDNGSITGYAVHSQGTYTGTISVNSSGVVSISNAAPVGAHTITIRVTDNCNATTDATFTLTVGNNPPTITPAAALTRQRGTAGSVSTIATVNDGETAAGSLAVTATTVPAGITVTGIINTAGTITANVAADCTATLGANTVVLTVTDGNSGTATANLTVNVTANTAPTLTYAAASVNAGGSTSNSPTTATDNGSITGYAVQSQGTYTGTISVNSSGVVSISNAAPVGAHTITIRATDNCNATTDATFTLTVGNNAPTITAGVALSRQRGTAGSVSTIATVSDGETVAGSLLVTATTVPAGITVNSITNTAGTITANVAADCSATLGANTIVLTVTDGNSGTSTANLTVNVTANTAPTLVYGNASVNAGGSTTNSPMTATDNGSITGYAVQSQGTYTGTISVNTSGLVSISNAVPVGMHTITIRATDNCGATTDGTFTLTVGNNPPTITAGAALTRQRGTAGSVSTIATVSDGETAAGSLGVTATTVPAGITVTGITNSAGTITANVAADCTATLGANTVVLTVTDGNSGTATANLTVNVTANTAPTLVYAAASVSAGGSTSNSPTTATDNGLITGYTVQSSGTYTGTISVNSSGVVSISSAAPVGIHTITIRATDNCNSTTDATFTLTVGNNAPTITAAAALSRQRGSAGTVSTIAIVSDGETAAGSLAVTATTVPTGLTVTGITNSAGTITANVAADCTATLGANTVVLTVADGNSGTSTANLTVNVAANTAPTLTYAAASVSAGASTTNSPTAATDNGSITSYAVQSPGTYTGTISVNSSGVVSISNAAPVGAHTITIRATDNCNLTTDATFTLTVGNNLPTITAAAALTRQRGTAGSMSTIATVGDSETPAGSLLVTATTVPAGITVNGITNAAGTITANVAADCSATIGANTVVLTVTDGNSGTATANLTVNVTANTAPTLTYGAASVNAGASTTNSPTAATDNGSITGYAVQSPGTYTGTISVNSSGVVSISNAAPVGAHTITIRATDNCNLTTDATFTLTVGNNLPTITAAAALTRQRGTAGSVSPIATVSDGETAAGSLTVTATTVPAGITVTLITNNNGMVSATVAADCTATLGANTVVLTVTDGNSGTATANLMVNVTANTAPTLSYGNQSVAAGGALNVSPTAATDNGSITGYSIFSVTPPLATAPTVNASGVVAITSAAPFGLHTIIVRATDNCGVTTDASFTLNVSCPTISLSPGSLSGGTIGGAYSQTITASGGASPYAFAVTGGALPGGLSLSAGVISGTPTATGSFNFTVTATDANNCTGALAYSISVACPAITLSSLPNGTVGTAYSQTVSVTPAGTYSFAMTSGSLPPGLTLEASTGALTGTPSGSGAFNFRITATGSGASGACSGSRDYSVTIACGTVALNPASLPNGTIGAAYNQTLTATPGSGYSFTVTLGSLPVGLTLNAATGAITGTPTASGSSNFRVTATAGACSGTKEYSLEIGCAAISLPALANATAGIAYSQSAAATPSGAYTYSLTQGSLPSGLTINSQTGLLSGMPSVTGSYSFTIKAQAGNGCSVTRVYSFAVACPAVTLNPASLPGGTIGAAYNQQLSASPAGGSYTYAVTAGTLPAGLSLNSATGSLSGTPAANGTSNFTVTATGFGGCAGSKAYTLAVGAGGACPTITLPDLPNGAPAQFYNSSVTASPSGSYSYAVTSGSLPPGLTLYASFGLIHGYPTAAGTYNFTVTATDNNNCTGSRNYSVSIGGSALASLVFGDFDGDGKADLSVWRGQGGDWLTVRSSDGKLQTEPWGTTAAPYHDVMTPGDYDGDGKMDLAVFRRGIQQGQGSQWLIKGSQDGAIISKVWGVATDTPVAADYDGDGKTDLAVWRGAESNWYILRSSDQQTQTISWGTSNAPYSDLAVPADYDGDGKTDIAVFRQSNGHWYIKLSSDGSVIDRAWGLWTDVPVAADYDGDGKADIAVWRGADTNWYVLRSSDNAVQSISWGSSQVGDVPAPGDYDGDGKTDFAVWREKDGTWYVKSNGDGSTIIKAHGQAGDTPLINRPR